MDTITVDTSTDEEQDEESTCIWVQCEHADCLKWRKIPNHHCADFSNILWFCHMNPDVYYSKCNVPEEKAVLKRGQVFVASELQKGSIVWAKFTGYPKWPAIITPDPVENDGAYIVHYSDGSQHPKYYHVEFLGSKPSHAWVQARYVEVYCRSTSEDMPVREKWSRKVREKATYLKWCKKLEKAIEKAEELKNLSNSERLEKCVFPYVEGDDDSESVVVIDEVDSKSSKKKKRAKTKEVLLDISNKNNYENKHKKLKKQKNNSNSQQQPVNNNTHADCSRPTDTNGQRNVAASNNSNQAQPLYYINLNGSFYPIMSALGIPPATTTTTTTNNNTLNTLNNSPFLQEGSQCGNILPNPHTESKLTENNMNCNKRRSNKPCEIKTKLKKAKLKKATTKSSTKENIQKTEKTQKSLNTSTEEDDNRNLHSNAFIESTVNPNIDVSTFYSAFGEYCEGRNFKETDIIIRWYKKDVDVYKFYTHVQHAGGFKEATRHWKIWRNICNVVTCTNLDCEYLSLKKAYRQVLLPFEKEQRNMDTPSNLKPITAPKKRRKKEVFIPTMSGYVGSPNIHSSHSASVSEHLSSPIVPFTVSHHTEHNEEQVLDQIVPDAVADTALQFLDEQTTTGGVVLKGTFPRATSHVISRVTALGSIPSSNPSSPVLFLSPVPSSISDIGVEVAMEEIDDLAKILNDLADSQNLFSSEEIEDESVLSPRIIRGYLPIDPVELKDVLSELTDLDDTLVAMAGDILGGSSSNLFS